MGWVSKSLGRLLVIVLVIAATVPQFGTSLLAQTPDREAVAQLNNGPGGVHAARVVRSTNRANLAPHLFSTLPVKAYSLEPFAAQRRCEIGSAAQAVFTLVCGPSSRAPPVVSSFR